MSEEYVQYISSIISESLADTIQVPVGYETAFSGFGISVQAEVGTELSEAHAVAFYASGTLVARAKLP